MSARPQPLDGPSEPFALAARAAEQLAGRLGRNDHRLALWLGSGWQRALDELNVTATTSTDELAGFQPAGAMGHGSEAHSVRVDAPEGESLQALVFTGRTHLYEGHGPAAVAHGVRTAAAAGCTVAVLTNAAGCLRSGDAGASDGGPDGAGAAWPIGSPVLISDQLNLTGASPLTGPLPHLRTPTATSTSPMRTTPACAAWPGTLRPTCPRACTPASTGPSSRHRPRSLRSGEPAPTW